MKTKKIIAIAAVSIAVALIAVSVIALMLWNGIILFNNPSRKVYPVRGVDVSHYQGEIDWDVLSGENISFAYIKATEGSGYTDPCFYYNYENAGRTGLRVGAYHFFSFDSSGETQADNFINTVEKFDGMLPPVIDVEYYGAKEYSAADAGNIIAELRILADRLTEHYGVRPVIYATEDSYSDYIAGNFDDCDIWIRNVVTKPHISDGRTWTFWQYTNRGRLRGYSGSEKYIDINVFCGTAEEFKSYGAVQ